MERNMRKYSSWRSTDFWGGEQRPRNGSVAGKWTSRTISSASAPGGHFAFSNSATLSIGTSKAAPLASSPRSSGWKRRSPFMLDTHVCGSTFRIQPKTSRVSRRPDIARPAMRGRELENFVLGLAAAHRQARGSLAAVSRGSCGWRREVGWPRRDRT